MLPLHQQICKVFSNPTWAAEIWHLKYHIPSTKTDQVPNLEPVPLYNNHQWVTNVAWDSVLDFFAFYRKFFYCYILFSNSGEKSFIMYKDAQCLLFASRAAGPVPVNRVCLKTSAFSYFCFVSPCFHCLYTGLLIKCTLSSMNHKDQLSSNWLSLSNSGLILHTFSLKALIKLSFVYYIFRPFHLVEFICGRTV